MYRIDIYRISMHRIDILYGHVKNRYIIEWKCTEKIHYRMDMYGINIYGMDMYRIDIV